MEFERARTKEQKDIRINEIIEAAIKQYNELPYEKITLASISKELSFSRVNLYKYFKTKEEIFLKIIEFDLFKWVDKLKLIFAGQPSKDLESFAYKFSSSLYSQKRMVQLLSILFTELEKNTSIEKLAEFKVKYIGLYQEIFFVLKEQLTMLSDDNILEFMSIFSAFAIGLYPSSRLSENQNKAIELAGIEFTPPDFVDTLTKFVVTYVNGLRVG